MLVVLRLMGFCIILQMLRCKWKHFEEIYLDFAKEPRNVRLGLASDGFNPFGNMSNSYSMWPVLLVPYNLPSWLHIKESYSMMALLIPGPTAPGKDMDVFLRPLIDELKELREKGIMAKDAVDGTLFRMRAALLWTFSDFPACATVTPPPT